METRTARQNALIVFAVLAVLGAGAYWACRGLHRTTARPGGYTLQAIHNLASGAVLYAIDHGNSYPGQAYPDALGSGEDKLTGTQVLALSLFAIKNMDANTAIDAYCPVMPLRTVAGRPCTIVDRWPDADGGPLPILYYPARPNTQGVFQYHKEDNDAYTLGREGGVFYEFIRDKTDPNLPGSAGGFILISAGPDRRYFTKDDNTNLNR